MLLLWLWTAKKTQIEPARKFAQAEVKPLAMTTEEMGDTSLEVNCPAEVPDAQG
jgi:hypothetical protein